MKFIRISQNYKPRFSKLELEALKYDTFDDFEAAYLSGHHGRYWHITKDPNFKLNPNYSPHDASSLAVGSENNTGLMVTPHIDTWVPQLGNRQYAVEVDLSNKIPGKDYISHNRGFGREIFIFNTNGLNISPPIPLRNAIKRMDTYYRYIPNSSQKLKEVYEKAWSKKQIENNIL